MKNIRRLSCQVFVAVLAATLNMVNAQTESNPVIAVEPAAMNVLYIGVGNPVNIAVSGIKSSEIKVTVSQGKIRGSEGDYYVYPLKPGELTFNIYDEDKLLGSKVFRVLALPSPIALLLGSDGTPVTKAGTGSLTIQQLLEVKGLRADLSDFVFEVEYKIISFNITVNDESGITTVIKSTSSEITQEMRQHIETIKQGQTVIFEDIKAVGPDGKIRELNPIIVKVVS